MARRARPPSLIDAGDVVLCQAQEDDGPALAAAVAESLDHLRPWMPWAGPQAADPAYQTSRCRDAERLWRRGSDFVYHMRLPAPGGQALDPSSAPAAPLVGTIGLHRRVGPRAMEIGYWTHVAHTGHGYMTAAAKALTSAAFALPDVEWIEIHTDEANVRSAAIPPKIGYRLARVDIRPPEAPAESGRLQIWVTP